MKFARLVVLQSLCIIAAGAAAHPGRLDIFGCHRAITTGLEHCHTGPSVRGLPLTAPEPVLPTAAIISFLGLWSQYTIARTGDGYVVTHTSGAEPSRFVSTPRLQFADHHVALDSDGVAGKVYRLYQAALNRSPDEAGVGFHMASMEVFGLPLAQIADQFMASPEFTTRYGNLTSAQFVTQLYRNVLRREPDLAGHAFHVGNLDSNRASRAEVLTQFSESLENQANVAGAMANGIAYVPYERPATAPVSPFGR